MKEKIFFEEGLNSAGRTEDFKRGGDFWIGCDNRNEMQRAESAQGLGSSLPLVKKIFVSKSIEGSEHLRISDHFFANFYSINVYFFRP